MVGKGPLPRLVIQLIIASLTPGLVLALAC